MGVVAFLKRRTLQTVFLAFNLPKHNFHLIFGGTMRRTILVLLVVFFSMSLASGQSVGPVKVIYPTRVGVSPPLRDIPPVPEYNGLAPRVIENQPSIYEGQAYRLWILFCRIRKDPAHLARLFRILRESRPAPTRLIPTGRSVPIIMCKR